jgi:glycosyltransferase involved in cell wall biosynthesis
MNKKNILFISQGESTFRELDKKILDTDHEVTSIYTDLRDPKGMAKILKNIIQCDITYCWFVSETSVVVTVLASLLGKKSILVAGGYDVAQVPEVGYGLTLDWRRKLLVREGLRHANLVLTVSESTKQEVLDIYSEAVTETVYVGAIDTDIFKPNGESDEDRILTVGAITETNLEIKGLEYFARASQYCPDRQFTIIGKKKDSEAADRLQSLGGENLELPGFLPKKELIEHMQRSKVYIQPSLHESFGVSVAEAMACECVPVVSRKTALPEVVGETGLFLSEPAPTEIASKIDEAVTMSGHPARARVVDKFSQATREEALLKIIKSM